MATNYQMIILPHESISEEFTRMYTEDQSAEPWRVKLEMIQSIPPMVEWSDHEDLRPNHEIPQSKLDLINGSKLVFIVALDIYGV